MAGVMPLGNFLGVSRYGRQLRLHRGPVLRDLMPKGCQTNVETNFSASSELTLFWQPPVTESAYQVPDTGASATHVLIRAPRVAARSACTTLPCGGQLRCRDRI